MKIRMVCIVGAALLAGCQPEQNEAPKQASEPPATAAIPAPVSAPVVTEGAPPAAVAPVAAPAAKPAPKAATGDKPAATARAPKVEVAPAAPVAATPAPQPAAQAVAAPAPAPAAAPVPVAKSGLSDTEALALAKKRNCFACHAVDKKVVGPAWKDVAAKYRGDAGAQTRLETKIAQGGSGAWGSMAMPPQPQVAAEERTQLVRFILGLK